MEDRDLYINEILSKYADTVYRICFMYLHNKSDAEDAFQEIFLKLFLNSNSIEDDEHEKAWIIRVSINHCKDTLKSYWYKKVEVRNDIQPSLEKKTDYELLETVRLLPKKYKDVIYLFYYEGYSVVEMSKILKMKENTIYSHLHRAKELLKEKLEECENGYSF
jgi:RNA polymerase sigma-70 factor (ECF subfamily)